MCLIKPLPMITHNIMFLLRNEKNCELDILLSWPVSLSNNPPCLEPWAPQVNVPGVCKQAEYQNSDFYMSIIIYLLIPAT